MPTARRTVVAMCAIATAAMALTGCNGTKDRASDPIDLPLATMPPSTEPIADMTASQLLTTAEQDMRDAGALTYQADGTDDGSPMHVKASINSEGACTAAMDMGEGKVQLIVPGGASSYVKADKDFWTQNADADAARLLAGKWVKLPSSQLGEDGLTAMCDLDDLMDNVSEDDDADGTTLTKKPPVEQDGKQVIPLVQTAADGTVTDIYVSTGAAPYVVKSVDHSDDAPGTVVFTDLGKQPDVAPPPGAVDPKDVSGGSSGL